MLLQMFLISHYNRAWRYDPRPAKASQNQGQRVCLKRLQYPFLCLRVDYTATMHFVMASRFAQATFSHCAVVAMHVLFALDTQRQSFFPTSEVTGDDPNRRDCYPGLEGYVRRAIWRRRLQNPDPSRTETDDIVVIFNQNHSATLAACGITRAALLSIVRIEYLCIIRLKQRTRLTH